MKFLQYFLVVILIFFNQPKRTSAQWVQTNGPFGGTVNCFAINEKYIFTSISDKGVFRSSDDGKSWEAVSKGLTDTDIRHLVISGHNLLTITLRGIFLSVDNGANWVITRSIKSDDLILSVTADNKKVFFITYKGNIFKSTDCGLSWSESKTKFSGYRNSLAISGHNLLAGTFRFGVLLSSDDGENWVTTNAGAGPDFNYFSAETFANSDTILILGSNKGALLSSDNGINWVFSNDGLPNSTTIDALAACGPNVIAATDHDAYRSSNNGRTWTEFNAAAALPCVNCFASKGDNIYFGTRYNGIFRSTNNGNSFSNDDICIASNKITAFSVIDNYLFAASSGGGVFSTTNNGSNWTSVSKGLEDTHVLALASLGKNLFAGTYYHGMFISTDNGRCWNKINNGFPADIHIFSLLSKNNRVFAGTNEGVFVSSNNGANWNSTNNGLNYFSYSLPPKYWHKFKDGPIDLPKEEFIKKVSSEPVHVNILASYGNYLFAGTFYGLYFSTDDGKNWALMNPELEHENVTALAISGNRLFIGTYIYSCVQLTGNIYSSELSGNKFGNIDTCLADANVFTLACYEDKLFASTENGLLLSTDNGKLWRNINSGLPKHDVLTIAFFNKIIFVGTSYNGIWKKAL